VVLVIIRAKQRGVGMYKKLTNIIIIFFVFFSSYAMALPVKKQALLVGISDYKGSKNDLPGVKQDIERMKKLFKRWGFEVKVLYGKNALDVKNSLEAYAKRLAKKDVFVYYYSGHGSFTPDENGDEEDGRDEVFILSDGHTDTRLIDDELNRYFNNIKARKFILFDSCHSGTANKGSGQGKDGSMEKSIPQSSLPPLSPQEAYLAKKVMIQQGSTLKGGEYIVLAAAGDEEKALATKKGSLFSREFYMLLSDAKNSKWRLSEIREEVEFTVATYCRKNKKREYHPQLSASNSAFKKISIKEYLKISN